MRTAAFADDAQTLFSGEMGTPPPALSPETAVRIAEDLYGIAGQATILSGERDLNFRIDVADGRAFVLKLSHPAESASVTSLQREILRCLESLDAPRLPVLVPTLSGREGGEFPAEGGVVMAVQLVSFLDGIGLHATSPSSSQARALGIALARLDRALAGFAHPAAARELLWDVGRSECVRPLAAFIDDAGLRRLVVAALDGFEHRCAPVLPELRRQVIHNDFNPHNVLMEAGAPDRVAGVIDFGDALLAPLVNELATALSYHVEDSDDPLGYAADFAAAYHGRMPLLSEEVDILFDLVLARLAMHLAITHWRAAREAGNAAYLKRNVARTRRGLVRLSEIGRQDGTARLAAELAGV